LRAETPRSDEAPNPRKDLAGLNSKGGLEIPDMELERSRRGLEGNLRVTVGARRKGTLLLLTLSLLLLLLGMAAPRLRFRRGSRRVPVLVRAVRGRMTNLECTPLASKVCRAKNPDRKVHPRPAKSVLEMATFSKNGFWESVVEWKIPTKQ
jgi:hypothetical protein